MKTFRIFIIGAFLLSGLLTNAVAGVIMSAPVKLESQRLRWKSRAIRIAVSNSMTRPNSNIKSDSDVMGAIGRSVRAWSSVADIDLQLENSDRQNVSPAGPVGDGVSLITIAQTPENVLFFSKDYDTASAKTRIYFNRKGNVTEADIVLNPFQQFSTDGSFGTFDLESTLTHEIGHLLGLHHSGVLGAAMADSFARNGTMGFVDFAPRTLAESDIAAIRELYGVRSDEDDCCSSINGKISATASRQNISLRLWAEEAETGRVMAQTETGQDGSFRLGGLSAGNYSLYWKGVDSSSTVSTGELGDVRLEKGESKILNSKVSLRPIDMSIRYLGLNGRLADFGVMLNGGRTYVVNLAGKNLDPVSSRITFNTSLITILPSSMAPEAFAGDVSGISFAINVDAGTAPGQYSIFVNALDGSRTALIGALSVK